MPEIPRAQDQLFSTGQSARDKYAALVVGRPGWGALLKYELVQLASQHVPGALGLALRQALFPTLLGACGRNVVFGQNVVLRHPHKIRIADNVVIDDNCLIDAKGDANAGITIGTGVFIGRNSILSCKNGDIAIADGANIGFNCEAAIMIRRMRRCRWRCRRADRRASPSATAAGLAPVPRCSTA
jgi:serine acetyltransferase